MQLCPADLLFLSGADASAFAHAQFTSDVKALAPGIWQWSAWLDAQGRVRHFFALLRPKPEQLIVWLPLGGADSMREALTRFVLRSKVALASSRAWALHALDASDLKRPLASTEIVDHGAGFALSLPGTKQRIAWLAPSSDSSTDLAALGAWRLDDIAAGLPLLPPALGAEFVPQALDLERFDAIRFDKGCYPGQEIAARLHFRGGNKRRLHRLRIDGAPPESGTIIVANGAKNAGEILYSAPASNEVSEALAVIANEHDENTVFATLSGKFIEAIL